MHSGQDIATPPRIERACARNLLDFVHAFQSAAPEIGAEAIECAGGIAAFTGFGSPLTTLKGAGPEIDDSDLQAVESFFRRRGAEQVVIEAAPWITESTVERLMQRGYRLIGSENVVVHKGPFAAPAPLHPVAAIDEASWPELQLHVNGAGDSPEWRVLTSASARVRDAMRFGVVEQSGSYIACGEVFPVDHVALFGNDATLLAARGRGAQRAIIHHRMRQIANAGFVLAAAEVAAGSVSERNYLRCGFYVAYARSHYALRVCRQSILDSASTREG